MVELLNQELFYNKNIIKENTLYKDFESEYLVSVFNLLYVQLNKSKILQNVC